MIIRGGISKFLLKNPLPFMGYDCVLPVKQFSLNGMNGGVFTIFRYPLKEATSDVQWFYMVDM